jgi:hypothetical protein
MTDSVEKVLSGVGTNFLRTAGALGVLGRGGPLQPERIQPVAFADALRDIANRIRRSARFCANFVAAIFSAFSTESTLDLGAVRSAYDQLAHGRATLL